MKVNSKMAYSTAKELSIVKTKSLKEKRRSKQIMLRYLRETG
jgi:hypothetical protein